LVKIEELVGGFYFGRVYFLKKKKLDGLRIVIAWY